MRVTGFAVVAMITSLAAALACGGSNPPPQTPVAAVAPAPGAPGDAVTPRTVGDAGATSTTTQTLTGSRGGTRLTPLSDGGAGDGGHHPELGRSVADIRAIITSHRDEMRACYDKALAAHPGIEGSIDIRWTVDPAGVVTESDVDTSHSEIIEPTVGNCLIGIVKKIHFNASPKGFETKAHYPFNFHPHAKHTFDTN